MGMQNKSESISLPNAYLIIAAMFSLIKYTNPIVNPIWETAIAVFTKAFPFGP